MSISSLEGSPLPVDLATKYEKLAAEYAKVRSQIAVLRKAVLDEQHKSSQLKEDLRCKEQTLRKHDQELESLSFRNQQLTKRVTVLQEELDRFQNQGKKGRKSDVIPSHDESVVLQEELEKKIAENERLALLLEDNNATHEREAAEWKSAAAKYERALQSKDSSAKLQNNQAASFSAWNLVKALPFVELLTTVNRLLAACSPTTSTELNLDDCQSRLASFRSAWSAKNHTDLFKCFDAYLDSINSIVGKFTSREVEALVEEVLKLLRELRTSLEPCLANGLSPDQFRTAISRVTVVARSFRNALNSHTSELKSSIDSCNGRSPYAHILVAVSAVCTSSGAIWKLANTGLLHTEPQFQNRNNDELCSHSCQQCPTLIQKISELEEKILTVTYSTEEKRELSVNNSSINVDASHTTFSNEFGTVSKPATYPYSESVIENIIISRVNAAVTDRQIAEGKFTTLLKEKDAMQERLEHCVEQLTNHCSLSSKLQEELTVTTRNYEEQLSSMSEHIVNMKDTMAAQETQIEELMFEITAKDKKSGRQK